MDNRLPNGHKTRCELRGNIILRDLMHRRDVEADCEEKRTDFVMQFASEIGALLFLHVRQLLIQAIVLEVHCGQTGDHLIEFMSKMSKLRRAIFGNAGSIVAAPDVDKGDIEIVERTKPPRKRPVDEAEDKCAEDYQHHECQSDVAPRLSQLIAGICR